MKKKHHLVWSVQWVHVEYGGPQSAAGKTYHLTREQAIDGIAAREAEGDKTFYAEGYRYNAVSGPDQEFVDDDTYERLGGAKKQS